MAHIDYEWLMQFSNPYGIFSVLLTSFFIASENIGIILFLRFITPLSKNLLLPLSSNTHTTGLNTKYRSGFCQFLKIGKFHFLPYETDLPSKLEMVSVSRKHLGNRFHRYDSTRAFICDLSLLLL